MQAAVPIDDDGGAFTEVAETRRNRDRDEERMDFPELNCRDCWVAQVEVGKKRGIDRFRARYK